MKPSYKALLKDVTTIILDVDGVLTDGTVHLVGDDMVRSMSTRDGYAMQLAVKKGLRICIITGGRSENVRDRLMKLGVSDVFLGIHNKLEVYDKYLADHNLSAENVMYMGDDIPDYFVLERSGVATCPHDAAEEIKAVCDYVSNKNGGRGAVRDVIEQTLKVQGLWFDPSVPSI